MELPKNAAIKPPRGAMSLYLSKIRSMKKQLNQSQRTVSRTFPNGNWKSY
jgi:hypothetical protein